MGFGGFLKGLGKVASFAAPIIAAPFTGGASLALIGAGSGAANSLLSGGGAKGALLGGLLGGATAGLAGGAGGAAAKGAASGLGGTLKRVGGGLLSGLVNNPNILTDAGRGLGAVSQTQAQNRGAALEAMLAADQNRMLQDQRRQEDEGHLWKMLQAANYIKAGGKKPSGPTMSASGRPFTSFGFGPSAISDADKAMAATLEGQLMKRLATPPKLYDYESKFEPGTAEKITGWAAPGLSIAGSVLDAYGRRPQAPMPQLPGMPTPTPGAGEVPGTVVPGMEIPEPPPYIPQVSSNKNFRF